jgi:hypothetical protein
MSMNKFLRNIAVCAISLTSISYGANEFSTPDRNRGSAAALDSSSRSSVSSSPSQGSYQRFAVTATTSEGAVVQALLTAEDTLIAQQKNVKSFLRELARIMSIEGRTTVSAHSHNVKAALEALMTNIKAYEEKIAALEAEKKKAEAEAVKWHKRTYVGMAVSGIIVALLWEIVLKKGWAWAFSGSNV